jgi:4-hydroxybenzoyl-CoA reductase subunit beta
MNILPDFTTLRPASLDDAVHALSQAGAQAIAGGTDLLPNLRRGLGTPAMLVDLTAIPGFASITVSNGALRIGAGVTLEDLAESAEIKSNWPAIAQAAQLVAGPTHRAAATLGGNLCQDTRCIYYNQSEWWRSANGYCLKYQGDKCHVVVKSDRCYATYHGDVAPALMVLGAEAELVGPNGSRVVALDQLFREVGHQHLTLQAGEVLAAVTVPANSGLRAAYTKVRIRDAIDFPLAGVAVALRRDGDVLAEIKLAITGTNSAPLLIDTTALVGKKWDEAAADTLAQTVKKAANVLRTTVAGVKYRRRVLMAVAKKQVDDLWGEKEA